MKTFNIHADNVDCGLYVIEKYELSNPFADPHLYQGKGGRWTITWQYKDKDKFVQVYVPLYSKVIKTLIAKYGKTVEDTLVFGALKFKDRSFVRIIWKHMNEENKTKLMAGFLGGK